MKNDQSFDLFQDNLNSTKDELSFVDLSSGTVSSLSKDFISVTGAYALGSEAVYVSNNPLLLVEKKKNILDLSKKAKHYLRNHKNRKQVRQAITLLEAIEDLIKDYDGLDVSGMRMGIAQDKSISISWRIEDALFGAAIQSDIEESSWFLVQGDVEKGYRADGYLNELDYDTQLPSLIQLLIKTHYKIKGQHEITTR